MTEAIQNSRGGVTHGAGAQDVEAPKSKQQNPLSNEAAIFVICEETTQVLSKVMQTQGKTANAGLAQQRNAINELRALDGFKPVYEWTEVDAPYVKHHFTTPNGGVYTGWDTHTHYIKHSVKTAAEDQQVMKQFAAERQTIDAQFGVLNNQNQTIDTQISSTANSTNQAVEEGSNLLQTYSDLCYRIMGKRQPQV